jgi:hypothetical protein
MGKKRSKKEECQMTAEQKIIRNKFGFAGIGQGAGECIPSLQDFCLFSG